ncbi:MAG: hypothetical protein ACKPKO_08010 [Candidatus Fonsibacter sp.]
MHDPYHVYWDLDFINNDYTHVGSPPYLRFEKIRNTPFLDGGSFRLLLQHCKIHRSNG